MRIFYDSDIREYCADAGAILRAIQQAEVSNERPWCMITVFELCRMIYIEAREHRITGSDFRSCWEQMVIAHDQHCTTGYLVYLCAYPDRNTYLDALEIAQEDQRQLASQPMVPTIRQGRVLEQELTTYGNEDYIDRRFRLLGLYDGEAMRLHLADMDQNARAWYCVPPLPLPPTDDQDLGNGSGDCVIDTNNLLELLGALNETGVLAQRSFDLERVADRANRILYRAISTHGIEGKIYVPLLVLKEAIQVAQRNQDIRTYRQALQVLRALALRDTLWTGFRIDKPDETVLSGFVTLIEQLTARQLNVHQWPAFRDAFVLAHGIAHGCPIASTEWIEKRPGELDPWEVVGSLFSFLRLV